MARRVFLHIGTMKSGTSYLQRLWWRHRKELGRRGLLVPGELEYDHRSAAMIVRDGADSAAKRLSKRQLGAWDRILAQTAATSGDVIISNEIFCNAGPDRARDTLRRLEGVAEEVHVVVTTRDLGRILPSAWQQRVKYGRGQTFDEFWQQVRAEGPDGTFRRHYDVPGILDRWTPGLQPEHVHVVVHPRPGSGAPRDWLWQRMCEVTGVDATGLDTAGAASNESLGLAEVEVLRAVNAALKPGRNQVGYLKQTLQREVLLPADGVRFVAPPEAHAWAVERGKATADALGARGWHIVGDLADLVPGPEQSGRTPADVTSAEVAEVALASLAHEVARGFDQHQKILRLRRKQRGRANRRVLGTPRNPTRARLLGRRALKRLRRR